MSQRLDQQIKLIYIPNLNQIAFPNATLRMKQGYDWVAYPKSWPFIEKPWETVMSCDKSGQNVLKQ